MPAWQKLGWIVVCMSANLIVESLRPLFRGGFRSWKHTRTNLTFLTTTMAINVAFGAAAVGLFEWTAATGFGLLHWVAMPLWLQLLVTVMTLDLIAQYTVHYLLHNWKWMWRLHMVHHSDTHVDVTTGTRHHPIDFICRETFALIGVIVTGAPVAFYGFYRIVTVFFTYWNHSNVALPLGLDLISGVVLQLDNAEDIKLPFATGIDRGCAALADIDAALLARSATVLVARVSAAHPVSQRCLSRTYP